MSKLQNLKLIIITHLNMLINKEIMIEKRELLLKR